MTDVTPIPKAKKKPKRKTPDPYGTGARGKATRLHAKIVRARGACQVCGTSEKLQAAHIVPRSFAWTRTDETNAWCLCATHHAYLTQNPYEHVVYAHKTIGADAYEALRTKAYEGAGRKFKWDVELARLQALASELGIPS